MYRNMYRKSACLDYRRADLNRKREEKEKNICSPQSEGRQKMVEQFVKNVPFNRENKKQEKKPMHTYTT